jgi:peptidoglycan-associated lipoprotein
MKSKMLKVFVSSLVAVMLLVAPACRTKKKVIQPATTATVADQQPPDIGGPPTTATTDTSTTVAEPRDFVDEKTPTEEVLPRDIEELNKVAQSRGYIRDAFYPYAEAAVDAEAQAALTASAEWLRKNPSYNLLIEGHCDERGTEQYNLALGDRRANSARDFLLTLGIDGSRIRTVSYGEERPFEQGQTDEAFAQNRRAHLVLVR